MTYKNLTQRIKVRNIANFVKTKDDIIILKLYNK